VLKEFFESLVDLIYPRNCFICHKYLSGNNKNNLICQACWDKIEYNLPPFCNICGRRTLEAEGFCKACSKREYGFDRAWSVVNYSGVIRQLIHLFKYQNQPSLARPLAGLMIGFFNTYHLERFKFDCLVAIPLSPARLREREYNQSELLAAELGRLVNLGEPLNILKRIKHTPFQSGLKENQRFANVQGAFEIRKKEKLTHKNILLVDDLLTTGATCSEAAGILKQAGASQIHVLTLATTP